MLVYTRHVAPLGFKASGMFDDSKCVSHYWKKLPQVCAVIVVSNHLSDLEQYIQVFRLTRKQYDRFARGSLSLIPTGCCCATGRDHLEGPDIMFNGRFKNKRHIQEMVTAVENVLLNENRECK
jgi:hypothetical protein